MFVYVGGNLLIYKLSLQLLEILPFGILHLSAIIMMFVNIILTVCMFGGIVV